MAVGIMIFIFVHRELSFDRFHQQAKNIYRVNLKIDIQGEIQNSPNTSAAMGPDLMNYFAEITDFTRLSNHQKVSVLKDDQQVVVKQTLFADSNFFAVFDFEMISGNPQTALTEPYTVVLTKKLASKLFDEENPIGQLIQLDDNKNLYKVTAIAADCPPNSHIQFEMLKSYATQMKGEDGWDSNFNLYTYLVLAEGTDVESLVKKTEELAYEKVNYKFEGMGINLQLSYFPLTSIRLHSLLNYEMTETNTMNKVLLFSLVGLFIMFIAGFNYVNLTIARSGKRAREIGMRKILGANRLILNKQFYIETTLLMVASFVVSLLMAELLLPLFNRLLNISLMLHEVPWWVFLISILLFILFFSLLAGAYPVWFMGSFQPVKILKGEFWKKPGKFQPRNLLLLLQFIISIGLIISTLVIFMQIRYFQTKDKGFNPHNLIAIQLENPDDAFLFRDAMEAYPWTIEQTIASAFPGSPTYMEGTIPENKGGFIMAHRLWADQHYFSSLQIGLQQGRLFTGNDGLERENVLINNALLQQTGWIDPLGKTIECNGANYVVVGILEDYNIKSLHHKVEPLMVTVLGDYQKTCWLLIRYHSPKTAEMLLTIQDEWGNHFPGNTFRYHFINDLLQNEYATDRSFGRLFLALTILAIIIAMLGILGLSSFAAQQRKKEFGIRKVLGASATSMLTSLLIDFLKWIVLATFVALPLTYWLMQGWLSKFAYSIDFPWWTTAVALCCMILILIVIILVQTINVSRTNPVQALKAE